VISIIVYGRNDNYGYNLHKRAAISLNCLAEILSEPEDEILFVDYNSPDDAPTFPEAIQDTLTVAAKARLRILRLRPKLHAPLFGRTPLAVVEPVARNVALRRSNPVNRWVLSTNTDNVIVPRRARTLSQIAAELRPGFYHVPRFEVPEGLWESFDRCDPQHTIEEVRALGLSAHLNEVVHGSELILYDGPGDFQLAERADLFEIDGFDEEMVLGWHVDSNLARRLGLKYGRPSSLLHEVFCYHCDHTRQATIAHRREYVGNDWGRFVDGVVFSDLPNQRASWGCAGEAIEEIRLTPGGTSPYRAMLDALLPPLDCDFTEAHDATDGFDSYSYDPAHALPFLADLLSSYPRDIRLGWYGVRADMLELVCRAWRYLGFAWPILVDAASPCASAGESGIDLQLVGRDEWLSASELLVFEFGRISHGAASLTEADKAALAVGRRIFLEAVAHEHRRLFAAPEASLRRFVGVNCINNQIDALFAGHIGITRTPFSSRLRHGFVMQRESETCDASSLERLDSAAFIRAAYNAILSREPDQVGERTYLAGLADGTMSKRQVLESLLGSDEFLAAGRCLQLVWEEPEPAPAPDDPLERLDGAAFVEGVYRTTLLREADPGGKDRYLGRLARGELSKRQILDALRATEEYRNLEHPPNADPPAETAAPSPSPAEPIRQQRPLSTFAVAEDWEEPEWSRFAQAYPAQSCDDAAWRRVQLLYGLDRSGKLTPGSCVLVAAAKPDAAIAALSEAVGRVEVIDVSGAAPRHAAAARLYWSNSMLYARDRLVPLDRSEPALEADAYDAVVFPDAESLGDGLAGAGMLLAAADRVLKTDGMLVFAADIASGAEPHPFLIDERLLGDCGLATHIEEYTGFAVEGGFDARVSAATRPESDAARHNDGRIVTSSLWFLQKRTTRGEDGWRRLERWLADRLLGDQIHRLQIGAAGRRAADGTILSAPGRTGHVFFGPYLALPPGRYEASVGFESLRIRRGKITIDVVAGEETFAVQRSSSLRAGHHRLRISFEIRPPRTAERIRRVEIRAWTDCVEVAFRECRLDCAAPE
jgi:hypothetical protein